MPKNKQSKTKISRKPPAKKVAGEHDKREDPEEAIVAEHAAEPIVAKNKKPIDFVEEEEVVLPVADKTEEGVLLGDAPTEEEGEDEAGLDEEEINPFGDKWEV